MRLVRGTGKQILGLFLDDDFLALATLIVVSAVTVLLKAFTVSPLAAGGTLLVGCVGALFISVWRTARAMRAGES
jgi:hypothetical protein